MKASTINLVLMAMVCVFVVLIIASSLPKASVAEPVAIATSTRPGWSVYTNKRYNFTFEYPVGYRVEERVGGFFVISAPDERVPQSGISIDIRSQGLFVTYPGALEQVERALTVSSDTNIGDWRVFTGTGKEGMISGIEFKQAVMRIASGAIVAETINREPYKSIFDDVVGSFKLVR
ncbi:hypothetical protein A3D71_04605 [Candidatus Kaiserbacteria bacterium RIFCSPHIGHO2_02_FULL_55_20]|uniref:Uncharacterized protein n=1 Tax=Candidatus Kaiserbacteria bacterium RIFCSPHIGHO2_02_FULL_55_20 TaxID=1798497 RepID=A0A1F6DWC9_9BACT|nr:MAG: hypothetical protein A2680_04190 [Candidatus Kaiserbacteria bacterium RIFCSPHIGHO2_01_FULL_55_37]OGG65332.1 MAG: hypothetical protein A3D71_04605 [Candidatus Kaiserbacteria bacterium RIFCSPHIGHO2_02_FULL_55_20]